VVFYFYNKTTRAKAQNKSQIQTTSLIQSLENQKIALVQNQMQESDLGLDPASAGALLNLAGQLEMAADQVRPKSAAALAYIKRGDALRADLHYRTTLLEQSVVNSQIDQAQKAYEKALSMTEGNPTLTAAAKFGLAICAEERGQHDQAATLYSEIVNNEQFKGTAFPRQAKLRMETMADNQGPFVFVPAPMEMPPVMQPESSDLSGEIDLPAVGTGMPELEQPAEPITELPLEE
jgi:tetratricopeptide (TPR) repeat protein